jgi:HEAT repeat protein
VSTCLTTGAGVSDAEIDDDAAIQSELRRQLSNLANRSDTSAQREAEQYLRELKGDSKVIITLMIGALKDTDETVREGAAMAIGNREAPPKVTLTPLLAMLRNDPSARVRIACAGAVRQIDRRSPVVSKALITSMLQDRDSTVRGFAVANLRQMEPVEKADIPDVLTGLKDSDKDVRIQSAFLLAKTRRATELMPAVLDACAGKDEAELKALGRALGSFGRESAPLIVDALGSAKTGHRVGGLFAIAMSGIRTVVRNGEKQEVWPKVATLLQDEDVNVRRAAASAASRIARDGNSTEIEALVDALRDKDSVVRARCCRALGGIGSGAHAAVPRLIELLEDPDNLVKGEGAHALGQIGAAAKQAVPGLIKLLEAGESSLRWRAADALGAIGKDARYALPSLKAAAKSSDEELRLRASRAIEKIGHD